MPLNLFGHRFGQPSESKSSKKNQESEAVAAPRARVRPLPEGFDASKGSGKSSYQGDLLTTPEPSMPSRSRGILKIQTQGLEVPGFFNRSNSSASTSYSLSPTLTSSSALSRASSVSTRSQKVVRFGTDGHAVVSHRAERAADVNRRPIERTRSKGKHSPTGGATFPIDAPHNPDTATPHGSPMSRHVEELKKDGGAA